MSIYTHLELNKDVPAPSGYYTPQKEVKIDYHGREVLYTVSQAVIESSCCGASDFSSALVPGYIKKWRAGKNRDGFPVTEVEPVTEEADRDAIRKIIKDAAHKPDGVLVNRC
jgi:hypothetical protein